MAQESKADAIAEYYELPVFTRFRSSSVGSAT
jgi:hypothetical protein